MNVFVTGASGLLGRAIMSRLRSRSALRARGGALRRSGGDLVSLDLRDREAVERFFEQNQFDCIIHSAAERHPDVCESDEAATMSLNVEATRTVARCAAAHSAFMVYMSTDYVFDGTDPAYSPSDRPNPLNRYGRSKLQGEQEVLKTAPAPCVLRVPVLYGQVESLDESPVTLLATRLGKEQPRTFDNWAVRYPTHVDDVAEALARILELRQERPDFSGVVHWSGNEALTKYDMALAMAELLGTPRELVVPDNSPPAGAPRPQNTHLDCSDLEKLGISRRTPFREGVTRALKQFFSF